MENQVFHQRKALIVTQHKKEMVIAPLLKEKLNIDTTVCTWIDTDQLGTFNGRVERKLDVTDTLRQKCFLGLQNNSYEIAIASEGSFYPHPQFWGYPCDDERIMFFDKVNQIEIVAGELSADTNYNGKNIHTWDELCAFYTQACFPEHALILRPSVSNYEDECKGIQHLQTLRDVYDHLKSKWGSVYAETDMRALYNPTRMKVIQKAAIRLCEKLMSHCPQCGWPGFSVAEYKQGLPCMDCDYPTRSILSIIYQCAKCAFRNEQYHPKGKLKEDPQYCDQCNP